MQNRSPSLPALSNAVEMVERRVAKDLLPPVCIAVSDAHGELVLLRRLLGTLGRVIGISITKVCTAARIGISTSSFKIRLLDEQPSLRDFGGLTYITLPGGIPIKSYNCVVGAVGLSGRRPEQDETLAKYFLSALSASLTVL